MGFMFAFSYLLALGVCGAVAGCGALVLLTTVPRLVARQRATLYGVGRG